MYPFFLLRVLQQVPAEAGPKRESHEVHVMESHLSSLSITPLSRHLHKDIMETPSLRKKALGAVIISATYCTA